MRARARKGSALFPLGIRPTARLNETVTLQVGEIGCGLWEPISAERRGRLRTALPHEADRLDCLSILRLRITVAVVETMLSESENVSAAFCLRESLSGE